MYSRFSLSLPTLILVFPSMKWGYWRFLSYTYVDQIRGWKVKKKKRWAIWWCKELPSLLRFLLIHLISASQAVWGQSLWAIHRVSSGPFSSLEYLLHCEPSDPSPASLTLKCLKAFLLLALEFLTRGFSHCFPGHLTSSLYLTFSCD